MTRRRSDGFADQVDVHVDGDASQIRMPRTMLPQIYGEDRGWFRLIDLTVGSDRISGTAAVNPLNHLKVSIDRKTLVITIDGKAGHHAGKCSKRPPDEPNAF